MATSRDGLGSLDLTVRAATPDRWDDLVRVFGRRASDPGILKNRALRRVLDDDPNAWWVTCFAILPEYRRIGVGSALRLDLRDSRSIR